MTTRILIAGFGGQGVLFTAKLLAGAGMADGLEVSWLPSYGPEMRGGTANCSVVLSDRPIDTPIVDKPDILIAMNLPSFTRYENAVVPGGKIFTDSTLVEKAGARSDVAYFPVPATALSNEKSLQGLSNMIILGKVLKEAPLTSIPRVRESMEHSISQKHRDLFDHNVEALELGFSL